MSSAQHENEYRRPPRTRRGLGRFIDATRYSLAGLVAAVRHEEAFRMELAAALGFVPLGLWLGANGAERALLAGSVILVLVVELLNSAVEAVVDRVSLEHHALSKRAKDLGSAAVLLA
ncbi:MAG: diacylglycerol kinase, partial [Betaproteobacteria bacterium]|nr:diacylglycerol kinase [Betaproteobacteria bacterium]